MFVDRAIITIRAGDGGNGAVSFRREKAIPKGGPDGGNGGDGGDVILQAEGGMSTLYDFKHQVRWEARNGDNGGGKQCSGLRGEDLVLKLPPGTMLFNEENGELLHDLKDGERVIIAKGGRGGWGNEHYKRSDNQTPQHAEHGLPGQEFRVRLELKLIAEVGLVGLPNAGKSTMLAALTKATPKIANYPFTTLSPQLGVCEVGPSRRMVIADIPGLIEGASQGAGLGHDFLRHVERTRVLVHLLDVEADNQQSPADNYATIRAELKGYSETLAEKPELVVVTKLDLLPDDKAREKAVKGVAKELGLRYGKEIIGVSAASRSNLKELVEHVWKMLHPRSEEQAGWKQQPVEPGA
ncbi:MAG: GTPase ObgE [Phycisphaerales bacterium]